MRGAYSGDNSLYPDGYTLRSGVTTAVDAGGAGWRNFADFKDRMIDRSRRGCCHDEHRRPRHGRRSDRAEQEDMDAAATAKVAKQYPEIIVAVKTAHFAAPEWVAVDRAIEAGKMAGLPVMVDFGTPFPTRNFEQLISEHLRPGDISTHMYQGFNLVDDKGKVLPYLRKAARGASGSILGHGGGSFLWNRSRSRNPGRVGTRYDFNRSSRVKRECGYEGHDNHHVEGPQLGCLSGGGHRMSTVNAAVSMRRPGWGA